MSSGKPVGFIWWRDLRTPDPDRAGAFYSAVFGWSIVERDLGIGIPYRIIMQGEEMVGGLAPLAAVPVETEGVAPHWSPYFLVDDVDDAIARTESLGATRLTGPTEIMYLGAFASFLDPQGASFQAMSLDYWSPDPGEEAHPGEFVWNQLLTTDITAAASFYGDLFGYRAVPDDATGGEQLILTFDYLGQEFRAGAVGPRDANMPAPAWESFIRVANLDATLALVEAHGGENHTGVVARPDGRAALIVDPTGAYIWIIEP